MERSTESSESDPHGPADVVARLVATIDLDALVEGAVDAIWQQVPGYQTNVHPTLRADAIRHHVEAQGTILARIAEGRPLGREDFPTTRAHAIRRFEQGISFADFLHAFRVAQMTLFDAFVTAAERDADPMARGAALAIARQVIHAIEVGSTVAAEAYLEAEARRRAESDQVRRDVLDHLLAGTDVPAGPMRTCLRTSGLEEASGVVAVSAVVVSPDDTDKVASEIPSTLSRMSPADAPGIVVLRQGEVVAILSVSRGGRSALERWQREVELLRERGVALAAGVSTEHATLADVPEAYAEARIARDGLRGRPGVIALPRLRLFDYLTLREDVTARRLIRPAVRRFVEEDAEREAALIKTLVAYAECDLNATTAAARLHLHPNTARYRLDRVAEKTGYDIRSVRDVIELLIVIRLLDSLSDSPEPTTSRKTVDRKK